MDDLALDAEDEEFLRLISAGSTDDISTAATNDGPAGPDEPVPDVDLEDDDLLKLLDMEVNSMGDLSAVEKKKDEDTNLGDDLLSLLGPQESNVLDGKPTAAPRSDGRANMKELDDAMRQDVTSFFNSLKSTQQNASPPSASVSLPAEELRSKLAGMVEACGPDGPDAAKAREACQQHIHGWFTASQLSMNDTESKKGTEILLDLPLLDSSLRPSIWMSLLGCHNKDTGVFEQWDQQLDLPNQKVIKMDCLRTRPTHPEFEHSDSTLRSELEVLLTVYCKSRGISYKQGLNEIVAPLLIAFKGYPRGVQFNVLYALISKFLPSIFSDKEFESLQCIMRLFSLMLLYHEPMLARFLDQYQMLPELYATPWFITLFARKLDIDTVLALWDVYIMEGDPFLHYFVALALLIDNKKKLLECDDHGLPEALATLSLDGLEPVKRLLRKAMEYRSRTPLSFRKQLFRISFNLKRSADIRAVSEKLEKLHCVQVPATEVVQQSYHKLLEDGAMKFILLDCRSENEFRAGHLPRAVNVPPHSLETPDGTAQTLHRLDGLRGCHLCIIGDGSESSHSNHTAAETLLLHLLQQGFPHLCVCEGGFPSCLEAVRAAGTELIEEEKKDSLSGLGHSVRAVSNVVGSGVKNLGSSLVGAVKKAVGPGATSAERGESSRSAIWSKAVEWGAKVKQTSQGAKFSAMIPSWMSKSSSQPADLPPSEADAKLDIGEWSQDPTITFFHAAEIDRAAKGTGFKARPRLVAVSAGYVISLEPHDKLLRQAVLAPVKNADAVPSTAKITGDATLKSKHKISDLKKITSKKAMPQLLNLHWSGNEIELFFVHRHKACLALIKSKFAALARSIKET